MVLLVNAANAINGGSYRMKEYISSPKNIITCFFIPGHNHPPFPAPLRFGTPENQFNSIASTHPFPPPQKSGLLRHNVCPHNSSHASILKKKRCPPIHIIPKTTPARGTAISKQHVGSTAHRGGTTTEYL